MRSPSPLVHFGTQFLEGSRVLCAVCCKPAMTLSLTAARRMDAPEVGGWLGFCVAQAMHF